MTNQTATLASKTASSAGTTGPSPRERLLDAAALLFYREGVNVGVDAVCRAAGVSKRSMYQLFGGKDEVVAASLDRRAPEYRAALLPPEDDDRTPRERILHVFERLEESAADPQFRGCPYVSAAFELKSPEHPGSRAARRHKDGLTEFFRRQAELAGAPDPALLARQLTIVFDGSSARAVVQATPLDGLSLATAQALLTAAGLPEGRPAGQRRAQG
jgi:AcrR family transcriptional regulator